MITKDTGGPMFPIPDLHINSVFNGMTMRDYFAAKANDADVADQGNIMRLKNSTGILPDGWRVTARYMHADEMIKARKS